MPARLAFLLYITVIAGLLGGLPVDAGGAEPTPCAWCTAPKCLDGRFGEWTEPVIVLDRGYWLPDKQHAPVYGGAADLSATLRLAWDAGHLYVALAVVDDVFLPSKDLTKNAGDAIILRFAPDATPEGKAPPPEEFRFAWASPVLIYRRTVAGALVKAEGVKVGAARAALPLPAGLPAGETGKHTPTTLTKCWYEIALPWSALPALTPVANTTFGLEVQFIDDDGAGVRGSLRWRGMRGGLRTATGLGRVILRPPLTAPPPLED